MQRTAVKSSNLKSIGWHDGVAEVEFHSGKKWRYPGVSEDTFKDLCRLGAGGDGVGKAFNARVKAVCQNAYAHPRPKREAR